MRRLIVNVAFGEHYLKGQRRLQAACDALKEPLVTHSGLMRGWPSHAQKPYAFKACALALHSASTDLIMWMDAAVKPVRPLEPLWERIEREGYWFAENAWNNYQWTADSAYPDLFPNSFTDTEDGNMCFDLEQARGFNKEIPQVMACAFGLNLRNEIGNAFLLDYMHLAMTDAFRGPWWNSNNPVNRGKDPAKCAPCGPPDVIGHRHDQTAASVIAWRLDMKLTPGHREQNGDYLVYPEWFGGRVPPGALMVHDGSMK